MLDNATMITTILKIEDALNEMDLETLSTFYVDDFTYVVNGTVIATTKADFISSLSALRSAGFTGQHVVSISARANVVTGHAYNTYTDGHTLEGGQIALFNDDGKVVAVTAMTSGPTVMRPVGD